MKNKVIKLFIIFLISIVSSFLLIYITYLLPNNSVSKNIEKSNIEKQKHNIFSKTASTYIDIYTDSIIMGELYYRNNNMSTLKKAMYVYGPAPGINPVRDVTKYIKTKDNKIFKQYYRYWHGNLSIFKILFFFFTYSKIKIFSLFLQIILIGILIYLMNKNKLNKYIFPFISSLILINPIIISFSLQYYPCYFIMLISIILLLWSKKIRDNLLYYFFIIGISTAYFDFLTFPLITLGMLLLFVMIIKKELSLKEIILYSSMWFLGYLGIWVMKLVLVSLLFNTNAFLNAFNSLAERTSSYNHNRLVYFLYPTKAYYNIVTLFTFIAIFIYYFIMYRRKAKKIQATDYKNNYKYIIVSIFPFIWYFVCLNHSCIHMYFTHRCLIITFFAIQCLFTNILYNDK